MRALTYLSITSITLLWALIAAPLTRAGDLADDRLDNWHQWRGPEANGVAPRGDPPIHWGQERNVRWKTPIPGEGSSTPIVWKDRVFVLTAIETEREEKAAIRFPDQKTVPPDKVYRFCVLSVDRRSGKIIWQRTAVEAPPHEGRHTTSTYAAASPVTDGRRLYVSFGSRGIFAYDLAGNRLWQRDLGDMRTRNGWGEGTSPALHGESLVVNWDQEDESFCAVLDAASGETRWKVDRDEPTSWSTPLVVEHADRIQVIINATRRVRSYDLASGQLVWECGGQTTNVIPSPVAAEGVVYCMSSYQRSAAYAIPLSAEGDVSDSESIIWSYSRGTPYCPSPALYKGRLYFTSGLSSPLTSLEASSGRPVISSVRLPEIQRIYASPVAASGRVYFTGREGTTVVIKHGDTFEVLAVNRLDETVDASPAIAGRQMFLRGARHLYCLEEAGETPALPGRG